MRSAIPIAFLIFALVQILHGSDAADPHGAGLDPARLVRIDKLIQAAVDNAEIPGAVAIVVRHGKIGYHRGFGYADLEQKRPIQLDSIFRIASMTKAVTSVGTMILYEQGRFRLNEPVSKYLPEFKNPKVLVKVAENGDFVTEPAKREITIRDLLTHTSGIGYPFAATPLKEAYRTAGVIDGLTENQLVVRDVMKKLAQLPLLHHPGEKWTYGLNTDVLGHLIEVVSGQSLALFFEEQIFRPLKLQDTFFYLPEDRAARLVKLYAAVADGRLVPEGIIREFGARASYPIEGAKSYFSGGAGLSSTAYDYARFLSMLLNRGTLDGTTVLSRKSVELMRTPHFTDYGGAASDFGLGFNVVQDLGATGEVGSEGTYSWGGAFYTSYWIDPNEQMVAVLMSQLRPARTDVAEKFRILVYHALK